MIRGHRVDAGPCPYLPGRTFTAFVPVAPHPDYRALMDAGFRRSGASFYRPICGGCRECRPIRVDVAAFTARDDQRRCLRRNADLTVTWQARGMDAERDALYRRYQRQVHQREEEAGAQGDGFTQDGGVDGGELHARDGDGRLLAVSVVDRFADCLSSVYCYYDPDQPKRGLGTFMALQEIAWCQAAGLPWWYLGFLVRGCASMSYKARFLPHEVWENDGWVRYG